MKVPDLESVRMHEMISVALNTVDPLSAGQVTFHSWPIPHLSTALVTLGITQTLDFGLQTIHPSGGCCVSLDRGNPEVAAPVRNANPLCQIHYSALQDVPK